MELFWNTVYNFVWAALVALATVYGLVWLNGKIDLVEMGFIPSVISFIHAHNWDVKTVTFIVLFFLLWVNSWHQVITRAIFSVLNVIFSIFLTMAAILLGIVAVYVAWIFLLWVATFL